MDNQLKSLKKLKELKNYQNSLERYKHINILI